MEENLSLVQETFEERLNESLPVLAYVKPFPFLDNLILQTLCIN
jgi:hypothetical protein